MQVPFTRRFVMLAVIGLSFSALPALPAGAEDFVPEEEIARLCRENACYHVDVIRECRECGGYILQPVQVLLRVARAGAHRRVAGIIPWHDLVLPYAFAHTRESVM